MIEGIPNAFNFDSIDQPTGVHDKRKEKSAIIRIRLKISQLPQVKNEHKFHQSTNQIKNNDKYTITIPLQQSSSILRYVILQS